MSGLNNTGDKMRNFEWKYNESHNSFQLYCDEEPTQLCFSKEAIEGAQALHHLNVRYVLFDSMESEVSTFFREDETKDIMNKLEKLI